MKSFVKVLVLCSLFFASFVVHSFHIGVLRKPDLAAMSVSKVDQSLWLPRGEFGINQLIVGGSAYEIGFREGQHTSQLLEQEESELVEKVHQILPYEFILRGLFVFAMNWFDGVERYFEPWMTDQMYGVSKSAPHRYDFYADPLTRQVAYHGIHEIGQMMVDQSGDDMGCTVIGLPFKNSWIIGRNFDFEGGRIFDREKIIKWIFPTGYYAYVSVIWAGMVGAVTGVNEKGIYVSLNAAGSKEFRRYGTPSTLVLAKVLREAATAKDAIKIISDSTMFITDIFVLEDSRAGELYRIEKSPQNTRVIELKEKSVVTNHLIDPLWKNDAINIYRRDELTSGFREARAKQILSETDVAGQTAADLELAVLNILRDKGFANGRSLDLGNRRAIDPLIAAHSVVYNGATDVLYVSQGPGVSGPFLGYDLKESFRQKRPAPLSNLPGDERVSVATFNDVKSSEQMCSDAHRLARHRNCSSARKLLATVKETEHSWYYEALGDIERCENNSQEAKADYRRALDFTPAYPHTRREIEEKLK